MSVSNAMILDNSFKKQKSIFSIIKTYTGLDIWVIYMMYTLHLTFGRCAHQDNCVCNKNDI